MDVFIPFSFFFLLLIFSSSFFNVSSRSVGLLVREMCFVQVLSSVIRTWVKRKQKYRPKRIRTGSPQQITDPFMFWQPSNISLCVYVCVCVCMFFSFFKLNAGTMTCLLDCLSLVSPLKFINTLDLPVRCHIHCRWR